MEKRNLVFIVEDSETQRAQITRILELSGFEVVSPGNAVDALIQVKNMRPDAIVSDIVMPDMNGFEFCTAIRGLENFKDTPFVLLTSLTDSSDLLKGLECGADGFIVKPVEDGYLAKLLTGLIESPKNEARIDGEGRLIYSYKDMEFVFDHDYDHLLRLLITSFDNTAELNKKLSDAHIQMEERRNVKSQLYHYQRIEAVDRLAGTVAHDFNNMLMVIRGFTDFLLKDTPEDDKRHNYLSEISKASDRAAELTNQLLIFSRKQEFHEEQFDFNRLLMDIQSMLFSILGDQFRGEYRLDDQPLMIRADRQQIEQVIVNLVTNARDALAEGGSCTISSSSFDISDGGQESREGIPPGRYARLAVIDDGCGMSKDIIESIFDPFFTTKEQGKGTGLGLSTVFGVVKKSGGYILCSSVPDEGTTFTIYIPLVSPEETEA
jgi:signal transduction histidine kinase